MADYNINKSNGAAVTVPTGAIDNQFDIPLLGQDSINYGDDLAEGQLRLLENFANSTAPSFGANRTIGQLWYDTTGGQGLKIWDGGTWDLLPLSTNVVHLTGAESIAGVKSFGDSAAFTNAGVPFSVNSTTVVPNLNADMLDDRHWTAFATSADGLLAQNAEPDLLTPPVDGYLLSSTIAGARSWVSPSAGTGDVDPVDAAGDTTTTVLLYSEPTASGALQPLIDQGGLTYNAGTNELTTSIFSGTLNGNAATATLATTATTASIASTITLVDTEDTTTWLVLSPNATGNRTPLTDETLTYQAATGALTSTSFVGIGTALTALDAGKVTAGILAVNRGGTGVQVASGSGSQFVLWDSPTFQNEISTPKITSSGAVTIEWNNVEQLRTQDNNAGAGVGPTTGAQIKSHTGEWHDIGFNTLPSFNWNATDALQARHCGHVTGSDDGSNYTLTVESTTTDFPIGGITTIVNAGSGDYNIADGVASVYYVEPGVGNTDMAGAGAIGPGGVATLYRFDATTYYIWGSEITY